MPYLLAVCVSFLIRRKLRCLFARWFHINQSKLNVFVWFYLKKTSFFHFFRLFRDLAAVRRRNSSAEARFGLRPVEFSELQPEISYASLLTPTIHITPLKKPYVAYEAEALSVSFGGPSAYFGGPSTAVAAAAQVRQCFSQDVPPNSPVKFDTSMRWKVQRFYFD